MGPNKENFNPLIGLTLERLGELWDRADGTPGERAGGFTKGQISAEIANRNRTEGDKKPEQRRPRRTGQPPHPIDGSWGMMEQGRRGSVMARLRR